MNVKKDGAFERKGSELHVRHQISLREALLGFEHELVHLDGHRVRLGKAADAVTKPGEVIKLRGEGMAVPNEEDPANLPPKRTGALHVTIDIGFPDALSDDAREWARKVL